MILQILLSMLVAGVVSAQTLSLHQSGTGESGEVEIAVVADFDGAMATGISFYVAIPKGAFEILGADRPFIQGPLLAPAVEFLNEVMPTAKAIGAPEGMVLLPYAAVRGQGVDRGRSGRGVVARFSLRALRPEPQLVRLISTPIYESKLVLDDGIGEQVFQHLLDIELGVSGLQREKPADGYNSWGRVKAGAIAP